MALDIMFLTHDNLRRMRKEPAVLGLRYRGLNGVENDQNTANQLRNGDLPHKRSSNSSTPSNQSYDSIVHDPAKLNGVHRGSHSSDTSVDIHLYGQKPSNPLYGENAASHYASLIEDKTRLPNGVRKAPEGRDDEPLVEEVDGRGTEHFASDNGKINVHVTVMINAGTLADLKKQRSQIRSNGSPEQNSLTGASLPETPVQPDMPVQLNPLQLSPSGTVPRFSGHTGDVVGDSRSRRCCIIM